MTLFLGAYFSKSYKKTFLFFAILFYLFSNSYFSYFLLSSLENPYKNQTKIDKKIDKIIILGGGDIKNSPNLPLSSDAFKRVLYGIMLSKRSHIPIIFTGGGSESDSFIKTVKELERSLYVKIDYSIESKSLNTYQNAKFTKELLKKEGMAKPIIYLVTSAYHTRRAVMIFENLGFVVIPKATDFKANIKNSVFLNMLPSMDALYSSYLAIHEYIGFFKDYLLSQI